MNSSCLKVKRGKWKSEEGRTAEGRRAGEEMEGRGREKEVVFPDT